MRYTANFLADVELDVEANSPEEAKEKAEKLLGEYLHKEFDYAYLCEIKFLADDKGNEV